MDIREGRNRLRPPRPTPSHPTPHPTPPAIAAAPAATTHRTVDAHKDPAHNVERIHLLMQPPVGIQRRVEAEESPVVEDQLVIIVLAVAACVREDI